MNPPNSWRKGFNGGGEGGIHCGGGDSSGAPQRGSTAETGGGSKGAVPLRLHRGSPPNTGRPRPPVTLRGRRSPPSPAPPIPKPAPPPPPPPRSPRRPSAALTAPIPALRPHPAFRPVSHPALRGRGGTKGRDHRRRRRRRARERPLRLRAPPPPARPIAERPSRERGQWEAGRGDARPALSRHSANRSPALGTDQREGEREGEAPPNGASGPAPPTAPRVRSESGTAAEGGGAGGEIGPGWGAMRGNWGKLWGLFGVFSLY